MQSENFTLVIDERGLPPRVIENLIVGLENILHCDPIVTAVLSDDGSYTKIVMPGEHDFKDVIGATSEIDYWVGGENVIEFSFFGKKA